MRHTIGILVLMITVGVLGFAAGKNAQTTPGPQVLSVVETTQPHVVLAKTGMRQPKEALQQNEGCQVTPNGDVSQPKSNERDITMKGLVF